MSPEEAQNLKVGDLIYSYDISGLISARVFDINDRNGKSYLCRDNKGKMFWNTNAFLTKPEARRAFQDYLKSNILELFREIKDDSRTIILWVKLYQQSLNNKVRFTKR